MAMLGLAMTQPMPTNRDSLARWTMDDADGLGQEITPRYWLKNMPSLPKEKDVGVAFSGAISQALLDKLRAELKLLENFANLELNWDSYSAAQITEKAIDITKRLVTKVAERFGGGLVGCFNPYVVAPVANGGVYAEWRGPGGRLQAWIDPNGNIGYLLVLGTDDNCEFIEQDNVSLQQVLSAMAKIQVVRRYK